VSSTTTTDRPHVDVAVVMERTAAPNRWEDWTFRVVEVVPDQGIYGNTPRLMHDDGKHARWLYPGFRVELFADECKGYFLNLTSGKPAWFVSWRAVEDDVTMVDVTAVSVSYIEADRRMFAEERVENIALENELCEWLTEFTNANFKPDTGKRQRPQSFMTPAERDALGRAQRDGLASDQRDGLAPEQRDMPPRKALSQDDKTRRALKSDDDVPPR
jgi:Protein of unknown function (DUF3305)